MARFLLDEISRTTHGRCHLCHLPAPLELYGPPGAFGAATVTVDHRTPRALGGTDDLDNLMLAHAWCNSVKGTRDELDIRELLAGTTRPPRSTGEVLVLAGGSAIVAGGIAGHLFATPGPNGPEFNVKAAGVAALLTGLAVAAAA